MKHRTLALIALAAAFAGQSSLAVADEAKVEILVVKGQRLAESEHKPVVDVAETRAPFDLSTLELALPVIDRPTPALEPPHIDPPRIELARADDGSEKG